MTWSCPEHHLPLEATSSAAGAAGAAGAGALACPSCPAPLAERAGVPAFLSAGEAAVTPKPHSDRLAELAKRLDEGTATAALAALTTLWGCSREPFAVDWKLLLPLPEQDARVLLCGETTGDDALALAARGAEVYVLVPDETVARLLAARLREHPDPAQAATVHVALARDVGRLPLAAGAVDAICVEEHLARGFDGSRHGVPAVADEWLRVLRPRGTVMIGAANPLHRAPGVAALLGRLRSRKHRDLEVALAAEIAAAVAGGGIPLRVPALARELERRGLTLARHAPFPDHESIQIILPPDDRTVVAYFLDNLIRRHSAPIRAALHAASLANRLGSFRTLLPYTYSLLQREPGAAP